MYNRPEVEEHLTKLEENMVVCLVKNGMTEEEARDAARKSINSQGITKIKRGQCPLGATSPVSCMFCNYGHMTDCHYPLDCEDAQCSHYQTELDGGYELYPDERL